MKPNILFFGVCISTLVGQAAATTSPISIADCTDLANIALDPTADYTVVADIDCSSYGDFTPIEDFTGTFDGGSGSSYSISNLTIDSTGDDGVGLFANAEGATIQNVLLENVSVTAELGPVGTLLGVGYDTTISNAVAGIVEVTVNNTEATAFVGGLVGALSGDESSVELSEAAFAEITTNSAFFVGGLIGATDSVAISSSVAYAEVEGGVAVGGLIGGMNLGSLGQSAATGEVSGFYGIGGLVGVAGEFDMDYLNDMSNGVWQNMSIEDFFTEATEDDTIAISNCYAQGAVAGINTVGGLVGQLFADPNSNTITNCYAATEVYGFINTGGLAGDAPRNSAVSSYWDIQVSGQFQSPIGTGETTADMQTQSTFLGWDFTPAVGIWEITAGNYPELQILN